MGDQFKTKDEVRIKVAVESGPDDYGVYICSWTSNGVKQIGQFDGYDMEGVPAAPPPPPKKLAPKEEDWFPVGPTQTIPMG